MGDFSLIIKCTYRGGLQTSVIGQLQKKKKRGITNGTELKMVEIVAL